MAVSIQHASETKKAKAAISTWTLAVRNGGLQHACICGGTQGPTGECASCLRKRKFNAADASVRPKLCISQPNDRHEKEADRMAEEVMRKPELQLQRTCAYSGGCRKYQTEQSGQVDTRLQARRVGSCEREQTTVPSIFQDVLCSPGRPLGATIRAFMEPLFDHDFSQVRVHTDMQTAASAEALGARAYTIGDKIVFAPGQYAPQTRRGKRLLAHELVHTLQQKPLIARDDAGAIPASPLEVGGPGLEEARRFEPPLRPHVPRVPKISPPPVPEEVTPPATCPSTAQVREELREEDLVSRTEAEMQRQINLAQSRAAAQGTRRVTPAMIGQADRAIRGAFGDVLSAGRDFTSRAATRIVTPAQFAEQRVPDEPTARRRIGEAALSAGGELLRSLCILEPDHLLLQSEVAAPLFSSQGIDFVRDYQAARIGGLTTFAERGGTVTRHVTLPAQSRNMGHIVVHEAMHFYVDETYRRTAEAGPIEDELIEGGGGVSRAPCDQPVPEESARVLDQHRNVGARVSVRRTEPAARRSLRLQTCLFPGAHRTARPDAGAADACRE